MRAESSPGREEGLEAKLERFWTWLFDIQSEDPNTIRRARIHIKLLLFFIVVPLLVTIISAIAKPIDGTEFFAITRVLVALLHVGVLFLSRAGKTSGAAIAQALGICVLFLFGMEYFSLPSAIEWFLCLVVVYSSVACSPKYIPILGGICLGTLALSAKLHLHDVDVELIAKAVLIVMCMLAMYVQTRSTEDSFNEMLEARRQAEKSRLAAEQANVAKSRFLATMSHELRTPLNAIIGYADLLSEEMEEPEFMDPEMIHTDIRRIHSSGTHLLALINDILDLSKIEAGRMQLYKELLHLESLVNELVDTARPLAQSRDNTLVVSIDTERSSLITDYTRLRQIVLNLLSNACKFTNNGTISLRIYERDDLLVFEVEDEGIGMSEAQLARIFDAFVQADDSTTREYGGTGLGLTLSQNLAGLLGGKIEVESAPDKGSTFKLSIPIEEATHLAESSAALEDMSRTGSLLVVDDDANILTFFKRSLERSGFHVVTSQDGVRALELLRDEDYAFDALVLDIKMPSLSGWEVLAEVKQDAALSDMPVIVISGEDHRERAVSLGALDFLMKPIDRAVLLRTVQRSLGRASTKDGPERILIVDDEQSNRTLLERMLGDQDFALSFAQDGVEALELIEKRAPDVILLDLMMPRMDGFGVIDALQAREEWASIPVIVVTAKELTAQEREFLERRVEETLVKSGLTRAQLVDHIVDALSHISS